MFNSTLISLLVIAVGLIQQFSVEAKLNSPTCLDEDGHPVDWYMAYKIPELSNAGEPFSSGYAYAYITSESIKGSKSFPDPKPNSSFSKRFNNFLRFLGIRHNNEHLTNQSKINETENNKAQANNSNLYWTISGKLITDPNSIVLRTLSIAYESNQNIKPADKINSIFYNDAPVERSTSENPRRLRNSMKAHAKGVLLMDDITGNSIWLTHSTPHFPPPRSEELRFLENSKSFGQTFMCINFDLRQSGKQIVDHLVNMYPLVYDSQVSDRLLSLIPEIHELEVSSSRKNRRRDRKSTVKLAQKISTGAGENLFIYSKSAEFGEDLYSDWIDKELQTTLFVETWRNGAGTPLNSSCPQNNYRVNNVQDLKVMQTGKKISWSYHQDHSKWAISENEQSSIVCISDINRMKSQFKRGGGAVCIKCPSCWSVFSNTILDLEPCPLSKKVSSTNRDD